MNGKKLTLTMICAALLFTSGCRKSGAPSQPSVETQGTAPVGESAKQRPHRFFDNGVAPYIASISPDTIVVHEGHAPMQKFTLTYEINNSDKATKAEIQVNVPGVGQVQRSDIAVQPSGQIEFLLDASSFDLGPTVRLRAHCTSSDTDWLTLGDDPPDASQRMGPGVPTVSPLYVDRHGQAGAVQVSIWSPQITKDCTVEAKVDGQSVELKNVSAIDKQVRGQLSYSDLQGRAVAEHHFEVELVVYGSGMPRADSIQLKFAE